MSFSTAVISSPKWEGSHFQTDPCGCWWDYCRPQIFISSSPCGLLQKGDHSIATGFPKAKEFERKRESTPKWHSIICAVYYLLKVSYQIQPVFEGRRSFMSCQYHGDHTWVSVPKGGDLWGHLRSYPTMIATALWATGPFRPCHYAFSLNHGVLTYAQDIGRSCLRNSRLFES